MSLVVVVRRNPYFRPGQWLEQTDEGWQKAIVRTTNNKMDFRGTEGFMYTDPEIANFIMRPRRYGLDK